MTLRGVSAEGSWRRKTNEKTILFLVFRKNALQPPPTGPKLLPINTCEISKETPSEKKE
jgi:hypothetical protein